MKITASTNENVTCKPPIRQETFEETLEHLILNGVTNEICRRYLSQFRLLTVGTNSSRAAAESLIGHGLGPMLYNKCSMPSFMEII